MSQPKEQYCDYCGEPQGRFHHSRSIEGPVVCGAPECNREATADYRAEMEERQARAEADDYSAYA